MQSRGLWSRLLKMPAQRDERLAAAFVLLAQCQAKATPQIGQCLSLLAQFLGRVRQPAGEPVELLLALSKVAGLAAG